MLAASALLAHIPLFHSSLYLIEAHSFEYRKEGNVSIRLVTKPNRGGQRILQNMINILLRDLPTCAVQLPVAAGVVDVEDVLFHQESWLSDPAELIRDEPIKAHRCRVWANDDNWDSICEKSLASGLMEFVDEEHFICHQRAARCDRACTRPVPATAAAEPAAVAAAATQGLVIEAVSGMSQTPERWPSARATA